MGGRATEEIIYTYESASKMESLQIDVELTAKASFAKFYADSSFDFHKYETQIKYSESLSQSTKQLYVGGSPPRNGNVFHWE